MRSLFLWLVLGLTTAGLIAVTPSQAAAKPRHGRDYYGNSWRGDSHYWRGGSNYYWRGGSRYYYPSYGYYYPGYRSSYYYPRYGYYGYGAYYGPGYYYYGP